MCIKQTKEMPSQLAQETELKTHTRVQKKRNEPQTLCIKKIQIKNILQMYYAHQYVKFYSEKETSISTDIRRVQMWRGREINNRKVA